MEIPISEKTLEDIIYQHLITKKGSELLCNKGLYVHPPRFVFRQVYLGK